MKQILLSLFFLCAFTMNAQTHVVTGPTKQKPTTSAAKPPKTPQNPTPQKSKTGSTGGHMWVDLGLPSGTLWALCNVGASRPQDYGNLYSLPFKSCNLIGTQYDIAYTQWGSGWCLPTVEQLTELETYCKHTWKLYQGTPGYTLQGPNGSTLFVPASGWDDDGGTIRQRGEFCAFWAGDLPYEATPEYRSFLKISKNGFFVDTNFVNFKLSIRPVVNR